MATYALSTLVPNGTLADPAGTVTGAGTNNVTTNGAGVNVEEIFLRVVTATGTTNVTIKAGAYPPALSAGQGDLTFACTVGTCFLGPFTGARFLQADGTLNVVSGTPANTTITAFRMPRTA
jgi:hypothetical protein